MQAKRNIPSHLKDYVSVKKVTSTFLLSKCYPVPVKRTQYRGILSWGITIHKSQGTTYTHLIGDLTIRKVKKVETNRKVSVCKGLA